MIQGDNKFSRLTWPLGVVKEVFTGIDNIARSYDIKTSRGVLRRSINCLHSMENDTGEIYNNTYGGENFNAVSNHPSDFHINAQTHIGENSVIEQLTNLDISVSSDVVPGENESTTVPEVLDTIGAEMVTLPLEMPPPPDGPPEMATSPVEIQPSPAVRTRSGRLVKPRNVLDL